MSKGKTRFTLSNPKATDEMVIAYFDDMAVEVPAGVTVAAAMLGHDDGHFCKSVEAREQRGPHCLMGICFECLVEIDGIRDRQACLEPVRAGMRVKRQHKLVGED